MDSHKTEEIFVLLGLAVCSILVFGLVVGPLMLVADLLSIPLFFASFVVSLIGICALGAIFLLITPGNGRDDGEDDDSENPEPPRGPPSTEQFPLHPIYPLRQPLRH